MNFHYLIGRSKLSRIHPYWAKKPSIPKSIYTRECFIETLTRVTATTIMCVSILHSPPLEGEVFIWNRIHFTSKQHCLSHSEGTLRRSGDNPGKISSLNRIQPTAYGYLVNTTSWQKYSSKFATLFHTYQPKKLKGRYSSRRKKQADRNRYKIVLRWQNGCSRRRAGS